MKWISVAAVVLLCLSAPAWANSWVQTTLGNGFYIRDISSTSAGVYVSTSAGDIYFSSDKGTTWQDYKTGLPSSTYANKLFASDDGTAIAGGMSNSSGVYGPYYLENGTWKPSTGVPTLAAGQLGVTAFVRDPDGSVLVSYGWNGEIYRTTDNGRSYSKVSTGAGVTGMIYSLHVGPDKAIYAGTESNGIFSTTNRGSKWTQVPQTGTNHANPSTYNGPWQGGNLRCVGWSHSGNMFADLNQTASNDGFKYWNNGSWAYSSGTPFASQPRDMARTPGGDYYATVRIQYNVQPGSARVIMTNDGGVSWSAFNTDLPAQIVGAGSVAVEFDSDGYLYYGSADAGLWRTASKVYQPGDCTGDGAVDVADYTVWFNNYGTGTDLAHGDLNGDGVVDVGDYTIYYNHYGQSIAGGLPIPEPATLSLLALGALAGLARRGNSR